MKTIEISVVGEASIKDNKCLVDYTELKEYVAISHELYEALGEAGGIIIEVCDAQRVPLPLATLKRIDSALAKARGK